MLNDDPAVLKRTRLLEKGISSRSQSLQVLKDNLQRGINKGRLAAWDHELTAQILWTSTFGLILKIMIEKNLAEEQIARLIDHHFKVIFNGIILRNKEETF